MGDGHPAMRGDFRGRQVLVTGATSGIGAAIARRFGRAGARLVLTGRDQRRAGALVAELRGLGIEAHAVVGDLGNASFCDQLIAGVTAGSERLDVLVNSAGVFHRAALHETDDRLWREVMTVNVEAVFYLCRAAVRRMRAAGGGVIVNIAGDWGLKATEQAFAYCVSKAAVVQMARSITADYARENIRINTVCPGDVDTPMLDVLAREQGLEPEALRKQSRQRTPNRRLATPEDIAAAAFFLASDEARHVTGVAFPVEGGGLAV